MKNSLGLRSLFIDIVKYGIMMGISKGVNILMLPYLTRQFGPEDNGTIDIVMTYFMLLSIMMILSLESGIMRFWNEPFEVKARFVSTSFVLIAFFGIIALVTVLSLSNLISEVLFGNTFGAEFIRLASYSALFAALNSVPLIVLRMERRVFLYNGLLLVQTLLYITSTVLLIHNFQYSINAVFLALVISNVLALFLGLIAAKKYFITSSLLVGSRRLLAYSLPLLPANLLTWLNNQVDRYFILFYLGLGLVGVYGASAKLVAIMVLLVSIFRQGWAPYSILYLKENESDRNRFFQKGLTLYLTALLGISAVIVLASRSVLRLLVPEDYWDGYVIIPWLLGAKVLHGAGVFLNLGTIISMKTVSNSIAAAAGTFANLILCIFLIPDYGIAGAAVGSFISELIFMSILCASTYKLSTLRFELNRVLLILLSYIIFSISYIAYNKCF